MTISYGTDKMWRLFMRWRGSVWKATYREIFIFLVFFYAFNLPYRYLMSDGQRHEFELWVIHVEQFRNSYIPLSFLLGFYVSMMVARWWQQFDLLPWPDNVLSMVTYNINGCDAESRIKRRTIARYLNLSCLLAFRDFSSRVKKRFPTLEHIKQSGMMTEEEAQLYKESQVGGDLRWLIPLEWTQRILEQLLNEGNLPPNLAGILMKELNQKIFQFIWASLPLVYTHVAGIAVYSYFVLATIGQQFLDPSAAHVKATRLHDIDFYVPLFTVLQMMFYIGWFKVGCELIDPWGEDDSDFDLNYVLDRHIQASFFMADQVRMQHPLLKQDAYMDAKLVKLPHTLLSSKLHADSPKFPGDKALSRVKGDLSCVKLFDVSELESGGGRRKLGSRTLKRTSSLTDLRSAAAAAAAPDAHHVPSVQFAADVQSTPKRHNEAANNQERACTTSHSSPNLSITFLEGKQLLKQVGKYFVYHRKEHQHGQVAA